MQVYTKTSHEILGTPRVSVPIPAHVAESYPEGTREAHLNRIAAKHTGIRLWDLSVKEELGARQIAYA